MFRFNVEVSDESYQVSWLDLVAEEEDKKEAKAKKDFKGSKAMMGGSIDPYASDDDDQLKVSSSRSPLDSYGNFNHVDVDLIVSILCSSRH